MSELFVCCYCEHEAALEEMRVVEHGSAVRGRLACVDTQACDNREAALSYGRMTAAAREEEEA